MSETACNSKEGPLAALPVTFILKENTVGKRWTIRKNETLVPLLTLFSTGTQ
jgi:hypothetical protein